MGRIEETVAVLAGYEDDPRIAADVAEIAKQLARIAGMRSTPGAHRDYRYRERNARRIIEQRTARALRKLMAAEPAPGTMDDEHRDAASSVH